MTAPGRLTASLSTVTDVAVRHSSVGCDAKVMTTADMTEVSMG